MALAPPWPKGVSGNPAGRKKCEWKAYRELRKKLCENSQEIHDALMKLVREGNPRAVIYAHQQLVGDVPEFVKVDSSKGERVPTAEEAAAAAERLRAQRATH